MATTIENMRTQDQIDIAIMNQKIAEEDHELSKKRDEIEGVDPKSDEFFYLNNDIIYFEISIKQLQNDINDIWQLYYPVGG